MHRRAEGATVYPNASQRFNAFNMPFDSVKVVIIGQDPYHGPNQANGLAFAVNEHIAKPPSLLNIFKELKNDLGYEEPVHGDLLAWRDQGVLLLNTSLSVERGEANSHKNIGWMPFVKGVIKLLNDNHEGLVFILWGKHAQEFVNDIDTPKHLYIKSAHPSPFSADRGFFGSKPFSGANNLLSIRGKQKINWEIK